MNDDEYREFKHGAFHALMELNDAREREYQINNCERWNYDQETGELVFSTGGHPCVVADFQVVGTFSYKEKTWLWSWGNDSIWPKVKHCIEQVREFGAKNGIRQLTEEYWEADEDDAWEMMAMAALILKAEGGYRCPDEDGAMFVVYRNVRRVQPPDVAASNQS